MDDSCFSSGLFDLAYPSGVEFHYWTVARNRVILNALRQRRWSHSEWVEIGCGRGIVVDFLRSKGLSDRGAELASVTPISSVSAYVNTGQDICESPVDQRSRYNGVLLLDVIEHLPDPVGFLSNLRECLPNVRRWLFTVPADPELWSNYDEFYGHHRRYTTESFEGHLREAGLRPLETRHFFHFLYPFARLQMATQRHRNIRIMAPSPWQRPAHAVVGAALSWESRFIPGSWPGTSLMCLAETAS